MDVTKSSGVLPKTSAILDISTSDKQLLSVGPRAEEEASSFEEESLKRMKFVEVNVLFKIFLLSKCIMMPIHQFADDVINFIFFFLSFLGKMEIVANDF